MILPWKNENERAVISHNLGYITGFEAAPELGGRTNPPQQPEFLDLAQWIRGFVAGSMSPGRKVLDYRIWPPCPGAVAVWRKAERKAEP